MCESLFKKHPVLWEDVLVHTSLQMVVDNVEM